MGTLFRRVILIIDDLGVERNTEYAMEQIFTVIDSRYRCRKPLIVTTNLKLEKIKNPTNLAMPESMPAYWNGVRRFSFLAGTSGRKRSRQRKRRRRRLFPKSETEKKLIGQFPRR